MRTAIIAQGPSAVRFHTGPHPGYARVIGCNAVCLNHACDWVCVHDSHMFVDTLWPADAGPQWRGNPKWFIHWHALAELPTLHSRPDIPLYLKDKIVMTWPASEPTIPYTGLAALWLLHLLGIDKADAFGYDMAGADDFQGQPNDTRTAERWDRERALFKELCTRFSLTITRMLD